MMPVHTRMFRFTLVAAVLAASPVTAGDFFGSGDTIDLQVGGFVIVTPKYEGSEDYEVFGVPFLAPAGVDDNSRLKFRGPDDVRFRLLEYYGFEAGPLVGWRFDREEEDADRLEGLGDVDGGVVAGAYAAYRMGGFAPFVSYGHQVSGDETGGLLRFGAEWRLPVWNGIRFTAQGGGTFADDDFMDAFFSVNNRQADNSGFNAYDAEAGIKDVYVGLNADVPLSQDWSLKMTGMYSRLVGDAADSPIVETENQFFGGLGLTYRFSFQR